MPGFLTDQELSDRLDAILRPAAGEARPAFWADSQAIKDSNAFAWGVIRSTLAGRGYSTTQVMLWDDGLVAQADLALWRLAVFGKLLTDLSPDMIDRLDRRKELETQPIVGPDGLPIVPELPPVSALGGVGHGACLSTRERQGRGGMRDARGNWRRF
jgi:hypothetical protein